MTPDEIRRLDNRYALLFIRGERPVRDLKYDILTIITMNGFLRRSMLLRSRAS